ncbi:zf-HC2 domain-containing protein [Paenibacillus illinoisensis]|uniref:Anti-sigma-W factor RsiW n=1 Tax=Paenibacillus illinoisensis TaxID=59845 RepID=A0ABW8HRM9_9BACL
MSTAKCEIIKDLLPLYVDEVCSEASRQFIEEHLAACDSCRLVLANIEVALPLPPSMLEANRLEGTALQSLSAFWSRAKLRAFLKGAVIAASFCAVLLLGYVGLFQWNIRPVPSDVIQISDVSRLSDGRIVYHVKITDGYDLNRTKFETDESGRFYVTPVRPILKKKPITEVGLFNMYYTFDEAENNAYQANHGNGKAIEALYFGSEKDPVLVWKKGMELPPASAEVEAHFAQDTY